MKSPVTSIADDQLAEIEKTAEIASLSGGDWWNFSNLYDLMEDSADIEFIAAAKPKDILGLIARLRAAEADAKRFRLFIETVEAESAGATLTAQQKHLFHCMNSVSSVTADQLIGFFDAAMERKA